MWKAGYDPREEILMNGLIAQVNGMNVLWLTNRQLCDHALHTVIIITVNHGTRQLQIAHFIIVHGEGFYTLAGHVRIQVKQLQYIAPGIMTCT